MDNKASLHEMVTTLDRQIRLLDSAGLEVAAFCLRMAKTELNMQLKGSCDKEFDTFYKTITKQG